MTAQTRWIYPAVSKQIDDNQHIQPPLIGLEALELQSPTRFITQPPMLLHGRKRPGQPQERMRPGHEQCAQQQRCHEPEGIEKSRVLLSVVMSGMGKIPGELPV